MTGVDTVDTVDLLITAGNAASAAAGSAAGAPAGRHSIWLLVQLQHQALVQAVSGATGHQSWLNIM